MKLVPLKESETDGWDLSRAHEYEAVQVGSAD